MKSHATRKFWKSLEKLPFPIQQQARRSYKLWQDNPRHPSVRFKRVDAVYPLYSARVNRDYRALGRLEGDTLIWFWVGKHEEYERILK